MAGRVLQRDPELVKSWIFYSGRRLLGWYEIAPPTSLMGNCIYDIPLNQIATQR
jgi:hypothetical protein